MKHIKKYKEFKLLENVSNDEIIEFCKKYDIDYKIDEEGEIYIDGNLDLYKKY